MRLAKAKPSAAEQRRAHRYAVDIAASLTGDDGEERPLRLIDLSRRGFGGEVTGGAEPETIVKLVLPGACYAKARIVWAQGDRIGAEFLAPQRLHLISQVVDSAGSC